MCGELWGKRPATTPLHAGERSAKPTNKPFDVFHVNSKLSANMTISRTVSAGGRGFCRIGEQIMEKKIISSDEKGTAGELIVRGRKVAYLLCGIAFILPPVEPRSQLKNQAISQQLLLCYNDFKKGRIA